MGGDDGGGGMGGDDGGGGMEGGGGGLISKLYGKCKVNQHQMYSLF